MGESERNADVYLKRAEAEMEKENKGKLKIFFGYAAGVGKTYAMLCAAQRERQGGADIVAGYIEPHARPDTMKKARGLELIPPRQMQIDKIIVSEMDLDAILERRPEVVLIDEMAHTNADGSRHVKRYQDIEEILNAGIDVYTTLNVQHIESVHDTVAAITGVVVRERVPDKVFDRAAQIEVIDLPPEELIARLQSGKVYRKDSVNHALGNFFTVENLTALREIALRRMADWLNREQDGQLAGEGKGNAAEHIMMCLSSSPSNARVIRQAARMAKAFHGKLTAFYVETSDHGQMEPEDVRRLNDNRKLAERFGAKVVTSFGNDIVEQIAEYAKAARVTKIVLGRSYNKRKLFSTRESMSEKLVELVPKLEIFLIPDSYDKKYEKKRKKRKTGEMDSQKLLWDGSAAMISLAAATAVSYLFQAWGVGEANIIMLYVLGCMMTALVSRYLPTGIIYGVLAILTFNFCFTDPKGTFNVYDAGYLVTFLVIFAVSVIITTLMKKLKAVTRLNVEKACRMSVLLDTSQILQRDKNREEIGRDTAKQIGVLLGRSTCCFVGSPAGTVPLLYECSGKKMELPEQELAVASWAYKNNKGAGAGTSTLPGAKNLFLNIRNGEKIFGVLGVDMQGTLLTAFEENVMLAILNESALAFEKYEGVEKERQMAVKLEQEQIRGNLLQSISNDFGSPLVGILTNTEVLLNECNSMNPARIKELSGGIYDDANWLLQLIENLVSVTRIENGKIVLNRETALLEDVIEEAFEHISRKAREHTIRYEMPAEVLQVSMDSKLIMQVIANLIDNAIKYTRAGSVIEVKAGKRENKIRLEVRDNGKGIPDSQKDRVFQMFYTGEDCETDGRKNMGLGLAFCRLIVEAHGGRIWVEDNKPAGAVFVFELDGVTPP